MEQAKVDDVKDEQAKAKATADEERNEVLTAFLSSLAVVTTKQDAMDQCTTFLADYLKVPASYVAVKKTVGEVESLNYLSANPGQEHVVGSKVIKQPEDAEEVEPRSGLSFDAFKLPEVPEEEEPEELPEGEEPPPKVIPVPSPLIVDNVMRNEKVKFFGVPKLGAYGAVPFSYATIDHETGCEIKTNDDGVPYYAENAVETPLIVAIDTIGKYRRLKVICKLDCG